MTIIDRIYSVKADFVNRYQMPPTKLYLGREELLEMKRWAALAMLVDLDFEYKRPEVVGMKIYTVNADSHLVCV